MYQETFRPSRDLNANGRVHEAFEKMAELYRQFHYALSETYWNPVANQKSIFSIDETVCIDAMEILKATKISNESDRFLLLFTSTISEVYSHANYNVQKLLYDDSDNVRLCYWTDILSLYKAVVTEIDNDKKFLAGMKRYRSIAMLLHFASLYSIYKDVADKEFIVSLRQLAECYAFCNEHNETASDIRHTKEFYEAIETIYHLRNERQRNRDEAEKSHESDELPTLELTKEDLMDNTTDSAIFLDISSSNNELNCNHESTPTKHKILNLILFKKQITVDQQLLDVSEKTASTNYNESEDQNKSVDVRSRIRKTSQNFSSNPLVTEADLKEAIKNLNSSASNRSNSSESSEHCMVEGTSVDDVVSTIVTASPFCDEEKADSECLKSENTTTESLGSLEHFDFREEFERRFCKKKTNTGSVKLPVIIGKSQKSDIVRNYRRKGLFDDVEFRRPISVHQISSYHVENIDNVALRTNTVLLNDEMDTVGVNEQNNNSVLKTDSDHSNKLIVTNI